MSRNFKGIILGLIFVFFDIEYNGFDVLPDIIGLVIVAIEFYSVRNAQQPEFKYAAICGAACGLINIVGISSVLLWGDSHILLGIGARLTDIALVVFAMKGFAKVAGRYNTDTMPKKFEASWGMYVGMVLLIMLVGMLNPLVTIIVLAAQVVNYVFMLTLIYELSKYV